MEAQEYGNDSSTKARKSLVLSALLPNPQIQWGSLTRSSTRPTQDDAENENPPRSSRTKRIIEDGRTHTERKVPGLKDFGLDKSTTLKRQLPVARSSAVSLGSAKISGGGPRAVSVEEMEEKARANATTNPFYLMYLGNVAALRTIAYYLVSVETFCCVSLTVGLTYYWYSEYDGDETWNGGSLDFILLSFVVISPISAAIGMAFQRRERALISIATFRTFAYQLYLAHCLWDWNEDGGREAKPDIDWVGHGDAVLAQLIGIGDELSRFLTLPTTSRSRHRMTKQGRREASQTVEVAYHLIESMSTQRMTRLSLYAERLKKIGLPSGEVSRVRQYERFISDSIEQLRLVKMYRTPQALRSLARTFTLLLPPFYAPSFAQVAHDVDSLGVGIVNGIIVALALTGLFLSLEVLEDPFTAFLALDGIDCREEFEVLHFAQLIHTRDLIFPDAPRYPAARRAALQTVTTIKAKGGSASVIGKPPLTTHPISVVSSGLPSVINTKEAKVSPPESVEVVEQQQEVAFSSEGEEEGSITPPPPPDFSDVELGVQIDEHDNSTVRESSFVDFDSQAMTWTRQRAASRGDLLTYRGASTANLSPSRRGGHRKTFSNLH